MGWFRKIIFLPFSMYMIILKFVFRISIKMISKLFENKTEQNSEKVEDRSRKNSGSKNEFGEDLRVRSLSGNESRSRNNSGTRNSIEIRSRNNSGNTEVRSRHNSGNGPGPGLLQRSDSIVRFPTSPSQSGLGSRSSSRRSSCSNRTITIQVDKKLKEDKMRSLQEKLIKLASERNEQR